MNPCALTDQLDAYLDGDLAPEAARQFEAHAGACPACTAELALAQRLAGALRVLPAEPCPYEVFQGALDRIAREARDERRADRPALPSSARTRAAALPRWQVAGVAVTLVLLLALALTLLRPAAEPLPAEHVATSEQPGEVPGTRPETIAPPAPEPPPAPADSLATPGSGRPAPSVARPAPQRPRTTSPTLAPHATPAADVAEAAPSPRTPSETTTAPTRADAEAAREGVYLAFALFADANRQATEAVRANVGQGIEHVTDALTILR